MNTPVSRVGRWLQVGGLGMVASATLIVSMAGTSPPAGAVTGPAVTVTPATQLTDGQAVAISASGFPPDKTLQVEECAGTVANAPTDNTSCDGITLDSSTGTDSQGNYSNPGYTVFLRPNSLPSPATITCDASHACVLFIGVDQNNFSLPHAFADISFSASVTTTSTSVPATTSTSSTTTTTRTRSTTTTSLSSTTTSTEKPRGHGTTTSTATTIPVTATTGPAGETTSTSSSTSTSTTTTIPATLTAPEPATTTTSTPTAATAGPNPGAVASGSPSPGLGGPEPARTLPFTGTSPGAPLLGLGGLVTVAVGSGVRRRALQPGQGGAQ